MATTLMMGGSMEDAFEKKLKNDMKGGMQNLGIGRPYGFGGSKSSEDVGINWQDYNYPPYLRLVHWNYSELPASIATICKFQKIWFELQTFNQILSIFNSFILIISASGYAGKLFLYAILNSFIVPPLCLFIFYQGYRGLAISSTSLLQQYKIMMGIFLVFQLLFVFVPMGAINGFGRFGTEAYEKSDGKGYWGFAIFAESSLNAVNFCIGIYSLYQVVNFNPYQGNRESQGPGGSQFTQV